MIEVTRNDGNDVSPKEMDGVEPVWDSLVGNHVPFETDLHQPVHEPLNGGAI